MYLSVCVSPCNSMSKKIKLCMFFTCEKRTFNKEWTYTKFPTGFGFSFELVILACVRSSHENYDSSTHCM